MSTARMESFSDGVFAVAITLLSLTLVVPENSATLGHDLLAHWPQYAAYAVSFLTIGIIWINHHLALRRLARCDHALLMLNLLLLMVVCVLPFATELMAHYLKLGHGAPLATAVYSGAFSLMCIVFLVFNWFTLRRRAELLHVRLSEAETRLILRRAAMGVVPYLVATGLAFVSPYLTLAITGVIAVYYALPAAAGILSDADADADADAGRGAGLDIDPGAQ